jgi:hypothetical protein
MAPTIVIDKLWRTQESNREILTFKKGVNLIIGDRNTGKTKWLETLDYLMGDDVTLIERTEDDIFKKYSGAGIQLLIAEKSMEVERQWTQPGLATKIIVDGKPINIRDYREWIMDTLGIPAVKYPQGDPFGSRAWPELGWRSLYRHIYRRQRFWSDLADQQPPSEQHASLLQFLGAAKSVFPSQYVELVQTQKKSTQLEMQKEQFLSVLGEVTKEILSNKSIQVAVTTESLESAIKNLEGQLETNNSRREALVVETTNSISNNVKSNNTQSIAELSENLAETRAEFAKNADAIKKTQARLSEVKEYSVLLNEELHRLKRAHDAGAILADLKITHCPSCDQEIHRIHELPNQCILCQQPIGTSSEAFRASGKRVEFEVEQIEGEINETEELLVTLDLTIAHLNSQAVLIREQEACLDMELRPFRSTASGLLSPEISVLDMATGRIQEQIQQLQRIRRSLDYKEVLNAKISELDKKIAELEVPVEESRDEVDFADLSDKMAAGFNTYLNKIEELKPGTWPQKEVRFKISEKKMNIKIGDAAWQAKLGGTLTLYFLLAYHYALLRLTSIPGCHYPGFAVIDFPAELPDQTSIADHENFLIQPFIELLTNIPESQLIVAGSAFIGLDQPWRIELTKQWI